MIEQSGQYKIVKYTSTYYSEWNVFIENSKNGTFLFQRDFMEYHKDRFEDFSLLVYFKKKLVCVLPANIYGNKIYSHQGLSYGGLILSNKSSFQVCKDSFYAILKFLFDQKIENAFDRVAFNNAVCKVLYDNILCVLWNAYLSWIHNKNK